MPKYRVKETITLYGGELILTAAQASARQHCLEPDEKKKGRYTILEPVQFKVGEVADLVKVAVHAVLTTEGAFPEADRVQRFYIDWIEDEGDNTAGNCLVRYRFTYLCNTGDLTTGPTFY